LVVPPPPPPPQARIYTCPMEPVTDGLKVKTPDAVASSCKTGELGIG
jgi:hypothetical protein